MADFTLPEEMPTDPADLEALRDEALDAFSGYKKTVEDGGTLTDEQLAEMRRLADSIETIDSAAKEASEAEQQRRDEAADLVSKVGEPKSDEPEQPDEPEAPQDDAEPAQDTAEAEQPEPVAASGKRTTSFAGLGKEPETPASDRQVGWRMEPGMVGYEPGMVSFATLADAVDRIKPGTMAIRSNRRNKDGFAAQTFARLDRPGTPVSDGHALTAAIDQATNEKNLPGGSLTAAGGWCAPSETIYDFCDVPQATDLVSLPEITINRGGIRFPSEPDLSGVDGFYFTEAELQETDSNGDPTAVKDCAEVPCPDMNELRLNAAGMCVKTGILQQDGWPEVVENFLQQFMQKHLRSLSKRTVQDMVSGSENKSISTDDVIAAGSSVLNSIALIAVNLRIKRGLGKSTTIEGVAPSWLLELIRADVANQGGVDQLAVSDAQIEQWLAARNVSLQFVADWQTGDSGKPGDLGTLAYPGTVNVLLYPAGTWFRSLHNVIEIGNMYSPEEIKKNQYTRFFSEDGIVVGKRCGDSINVEIPVCPSGAVGPRNSIACATQG